MSRQKELIRSSLAEVENVFENDTSQFLTDATVLQKINTTQSLNSVKVQEKLDSVEKISREIHEANEELRDFGSQLTELESYTDHLEEIAKELDSWSKELEGKVKRQMK